MQVSQSEKQLVEKKERFFSSLAHHPPQKLRDSFYFNYYNSVYFDKEYLEEKQREHSQLFNDSNNFPILCDRNYLHSSTYHRQQKFGVLSPPPSHIHPHIQQLKHLQQRLFLKNQQHSRKILRDHQADLNKHLIKMVVTNQKLKKPFTLQFNSLNVQLHQIIHQEDKIAQKLITTQRYNFNDLQNILYHKEEDIINKLKHHCEQNAGENVKNKNLNCKFEHTDHKQQIAECYYLQSKKQIDLEIIDDKQYRLTLNFPQITFYISEHAYEQYLKINKKQIKSLIEDGFINLEQYVKLYFFIYFRLFSLTSKECRTISNIIQKERKQFKKIDILYNPQLLQYFIFNKMLLTQQIIEKVKTLNEYDDQEFQRQLAYEIQQILQRDNIVYDKDCIYQYFLSLDQQEYNLSQTLKKIKMSSQKIKIFLEVLKEKRFEIEQFQILENKRMEQHEELEAVQWRYDIQTSSKYFNNQCIPKVLLQFQTNNQTLNLHTDFANLQNLEQTISDALMLAEITEHK